MNLRPYRQVDVFTSTPYWGNPLAVVLDGTGLSDEQMQRFARWTNLSETTFLLPPSEADADYRVRIFTPGGELPFAGHPTLGSCQAWLDMGGKPKDPQRIVQECAVGRVPIRRSGAQLAFAAPPLQRSTPAPQLLAGVAQALGLKPAQIRAAQLLDNGPKWLGLLLDSADTVLALTPDHTRLRELGQKVGVAALTTEPAAVQLIARSSREARAFADHADDAPHLATPDLEVRAFAAPVGITEDPVTGSLNASLAQWLMAEGHLGTRYIAAQGTCLERAGRVLLERDEAGQVWVGGQVQTCITGHVQL
ncbi:MAG: PhzF family phenazine biosynthesis protein [Hylemonella sp.]|uniref:PhzF family phenazine biosynthesis protein n=1 Tax=Hylemonella sp. TaxID=2066020 RepID=UPI0022C8AD31|nr:PhzF family phenazine biosynthesis protein [Hylemonella sp.]MCZ8253959.1 PhzF family phenazine biosynthesis protein [Hylemonella sp.]